MKIGVRCNPLKLKDDFPGLVKWLADNGFDSVDLMGLDPAHKAIVDKAGLVPGSFDAPSLKNVLAEDEGARKAAVEKLKAEITQASKIGLKVLFGGMGPVNKALPRAKTFEIWKTIFPEIAAHAEAAGVCFAIEPFPGGAPQYPNIGCTPETLRAMFAAVPSKAIGICYDPSHFVRLGVDPIRLLKEFGDRVTHVHAKDCKILPEEQYCQGRLTLTFGKPVFSNSEGWWRYCKPGDGEVNWRDVVVGLRAAGYDGVMSIELEDGMYAKDGETNKAGLLAAKAHLKSVIC